MATTVYGVIIRKRNVYDFHAIKFDDENGFHRSKLWYSRLDLTTTNLLTFGSRNEVIEKSNRSYIVYSNLFRPKGKRYRIYISFKELGM